MLKHRFRPPGTMVELLPGQGAKGIARKIANPKFRAEPDLCAGVSQADVQLGVFVMREAFVIAADRQKSTAVEGGMMPMIDIA